MGKFNPSTATGQASVLDEASVQLPVAPAEGTGILDQVIGDAPAPESALEGEVAIPTALTEDPAVLEQERVDTVPSLKERQAAQDTGRFEYTGEDVSPALAQREERAKARLANSTPQPDGGFQQRAVNFNEALATKDLPGLGGLGATATGIVKQSYQKAGLVDAQGAWSPQAGLVLSAVTENFISDRAFGEDIDTEIEPETVGVQASELRATSPYSKAQGRAQLGKQIASENARLAGLEPPQLSNEEAEAIGDSAQELYYEVNKQDDGDQFMVRTEVGEGEHKQTAFQLTQKGSDLLTLGAAKRKKLFPKQHVRTQKAALGSPTKPAREYTRQVSGKAGVTTVNSREQAQALRNLNSVANVVDPLRNKILLVTGLATLQGQQQFDNDVMFISNDDPQGTTYELAQSIYGIQLEKDGANYLTYYVQDFNGRMAPQQTSLDPTTSKAARFVTRNAIPAPSDNPRIKRNLKQMYAMHLVPDEFSGLTKQTGKRVSVDQLLPARREQVISNPAVVSLLSGWGKALQDAFAAIPDGTVAQISDGIKNKTPVGQLPQLPALELPPKLVEFINSKGEDGLMVMEGLIDFHKFTEAEKAGRPHNSYFNATMDGKTNGIASNGIQMGSENVASKTGVMRSTTNNTQILDNGVDIRDDLELVLKGLIDQGFDGKFSENEIAVVRGIAADIAGDRAFNKDITMTFGYGKEIDSFKKAIKDRVAEDERAQGLDAEEIGNAIFNNYEPAMRQVMDEDALAARSLMRSATWIAAWRNELFQMSGPLEGQTISLGATAPTGYLGKSGTAKVWTGDGYRDAPISQYGSEATSAAQKAYPAFIEGDPPQLVAGDVAYGGSIPGPVQSLDAATVTKTVTGKSWDKLKNKSKGNPYIHTVYDAFKTDAWGFDTVLEETNKNWLDLNMKWSYLESMQDAAHRARKDGDAKFAGRSDADLLTENEALMLREWIVTNEDGHLQKLEDRFKNLLEHPAMAGQAAIKVKKDLIAAGYRANSTPTVGQLKAAIKSIESVLDTDSRFSRFISKTNKKKEALAAKIKQDAPKSRDTLGYDLRAGAQYYAH